MGIQMEKPPYNVLLVTSNEQEAESVRQYLSESKKLDYLLHCTPSASKTHNILKSIQVDIILVNFNPKEEKDLDTVTSLQNHYPNTPMLLITESLNNSLEKLDLTKGPIDYLEKTQLTPYLLGKAILYSIERKNIIEELKKNEERYRLLFNSGNDAVFVHKLDDDNLIGKFIEVNDVACKRLGYTRQELLELSPADIDVPIDLEDKHVLYETIHTTKDGKQIYVEINAHTFNYDGKSMILSIARDITDRKRAEDNLQRSLERLRKTMEGIIHAMARTVETRDPYTAGHQRRVADLAAAIAKQMELSNEKIELIKLAALIHDLGKIHIPAEILMKPGILSQTEFDLIKIHPQVGYDILKPIDFSWPIADIVFQHHERIDGTGYPKSLTGDEIMMEAKIISVADVVEAMASHRPYRPGLGINTALKEIQDNRGILYDHDVVDICMELFKSKEFSF